MVAHTARHVFLPEPEAFGIETRAARHQCPHPPDPYARYLREVSRRAHCQPKCRRPLSPRHHSSAEPTQRSYGLGHRRGIPELALWSSGCAARWLLPSRSTCRSVCISVSVNVLGRPGYEENNVPAFYVVVLTMPARALSLAVNRSFSLQEHLALTVLLGANRIVTK